jgi:hypothetical protein
VSNIEIHKDGSIDISSELIPTRTLSLLAITESWWTGLRIYGENGTLLSMEPNIATVTRRFWSRLLANTVYNPTREMEFNYNSSGSYALASLKEDIQRCVNMDDDILTQFMEPQEIVSALEPADTFDKVLRVVKEMLGLNNVA